MLRSLSKTGGGISAIALNNEPMVIPPVLVKREGPAPTPILLRTSNPPCELTESTAASNAEATEIPLIAERAQVSALIFRT